jgi:type I restriction enzyme S subunit
MKAGWEVKTLGDIADVKGGKRVPKGYRLLSEPTKHPYITVSDFTDDGSIDTSNIRYVSSEVFEQIKRYTISSNDLYLSIAGTIGKTGYVPPDLDGASLTENACKLVLRPGIDLDFVYYFTKSDDFTRQVGTNTRIAAQPKLALERLKTIKLPIPSSLPEQQRIVGILDEAFEGLATATATAERNLQNARALFESYLQSVFTQRGQGWVEKRIGDVFNVGSSKRVFEKEWTPSGVPFYGGREVVQLAQSGAVVSDAYISEERYRDIAAVYGVPQEGDILMTARGTIGVGYVVKKSDKFYYKDGNLICLHPKTPTEPYFVLYAFRSKLIKDQLATLTGATVTHLPIEKTNSLLLPFPDFPIQKRVVGDLRKLEAETQRLESIYQQKLAALDELKKSLLHLAFNGEL